MQTTLLIDHHDSPESLPGPGLFEALENAVYAWRESESGFGAENPAHQLEAVLVEDQLKLSHDCGSGTFQLKGIRTDGHFLDSEAGEVSVDGNRMEIDRGLINEWYVNRATGIEQGFTLTDRPVAQRNANTFAIVLEVPKSLRPVKELDSVVLYGDNTPAIRYAGLKTFDATGKTIPSHIKVDGQEVLLEVDDKGAEYPITVDPTFTQHSELVAGTATDKFTGPVAICGMTVVVGANPGTTGVGAAYVFSYDGTNWQQQARLTASDGATNNCFGCAVAIDGSTVVIGAYNCTIGTNANQGAVYVFQKSASGWSQQQKLTASDGSAGDWFGYSVAVSQGTVLVGANKKQIGSNKIQGAAYAFTQSGTTWSQQQRLTVDDGKRVMNSVRQLQSTGTERS